MIFETQFNFGQIVYLKTDKEQLPRMITKIQFMRSGSSLSELSCGATSSWHYDYEIDVEKKVAVEND